MSDDTKSLLLVSVLLVALFIGVLVAAQTELACVTPPC